jgi:DNA-binding transcriptional regulator GbsR (MarR family)
MNLSPAMRRYILHWGEMGSRWSVNRSVAQIHAVLFLSDAPLTAEEIAETLGIARSNVSTSLRELQGWELVRLVHIPGDRRDHFEAKQDPWDMLQTIVEGRKRREIDPTLSLIRSCAEEAREDGETPPSVRLKLEAMAGFMEELNSWYAQMRNVPRPVLKKIVTMGARIAGLVNR